MKYFLFTSGEYSDYGVVGLMVCADGEEEAMKARVQAAEKKATALWKAWNAANSEAHEKAYAECQRMYGRTRDYAALYRNEAYRKASREATDKMIAWEKAHPRPWRSYSRDPEEMDAMQWYAKEIGGNVVAFEEIHVYNG